MTKQKDIRDYDSQIRKLNQKKQIYDKQLEIHQIKKSMRRFKMPTTSKIIVLFMFVNCTVVEMYSMFEMHRLQDLSPLYTLITSVVAEVATIGSYFCKSYNETKQEELVKLERDKMALTNQGDELSSGMWGEEGDTQAADDISDKYDEDFCDDDGISEDND